MAKPPRPPQVAAAVDASVTSVRDRSSATSTTLVVPADVIAYEVTAKAAAADADWWPSAALSALERPVSTSGESLTATRMAQPLDERAFIAIPTAALDARVVADDVARASDPVPHEIGLAARANERALKASSELDVTAIPLAAKLVPMPSGRPVHIVVDMPVRSTGSASMATRAEVPRGP